MVMSPIRPRLIPQHGFVCSTPVRTSRNSVFYSSLLLSPIFDEGEIPSRENIPQPVRASSRQDHSERMRNSSERIRQNLVESADPQCSVILGKPCKKQVHQAYQKSSKLKGMVEAGRYGSQNIPTRKEQILVHAKRPQRKDIFDNSIELNNSKEKFKEMRSPQKQTLQNNIEGNKKSPHRKQLCTNIEKSSGKEDQELQTVDSFQNIVISKKNKAQPEMTRSPQKKETLQSREKRNENQRVVQERPQRKRLSKDSEKSSGEEESVNESLGEKDLLHKNTSQKVTLQNIMDRNEEQKSLSESLGEKDLLHNNTSPRKTLQNSMDRNEKQENVQKRLLRKQSAPGSVKSNTEEKTGEASHSSTERKQQVISKIPRKKGVPQNYQSSKQKENPQAVGESPRKKRTSENSINSKRKEGTETMRVKRKRTSQNNIHSKMKEYPRRERRRPRKKLASSNSMLSKGKKDPQALVESRKKEASQNRIIRSRQKEDTISSEKQASQGSIRDVLQIEVRRSQPSEELIKPKSKKGHVSTSKQKKQERSQRKEESRNNSKQNTKPQMSDAEKENISLPGSSSRGKKTNTSSTSTLKSSHPTYKTVRKRKQHAVESLAKFLTQGRLSIEYNPFRNGQKLIAPSEDDGNLRRSKRTRVKPLDYWRGERCLYKPTNHGPDFFRISSPA